MAIKASECVIVMAGLLNVGLKPSRLSSILGGGERKEFNMPTLAGLKLRVRQLVFPNRLDKILTIPGWTSREQLEYLMSQARSLPDGALLVEVGVWYGRSALAMAEACRGTEKRLYAIDPWRNYSQNDNPEGSGYDGTHMIEASGRTSFDEVYEDFLHNCRKFELEPWVIPVRAISVEAARNWARGPIGLIFIDANHEYESVLSDLHAWAPHVIKGGIICGDDWEYTGGGTSKSVQIAVKAFVAEHHEYKLELPCYNTWSIHC